MDTKIWGQEMYDNIVAINRELRSFGPKHSTWRSPIWVVDNYTGFDPTKGVDTVDGEHPNDSGNKKFAEKMFPAVRDAIKFAGQSREPFSFRESAC